MPSAYINGIVSPTSTSSYNAAQLSCRLDTVQARVGHSGLHPMVIIGIGLYASRQANGAGNLYMGIDSGVAVVGPFGVEGSATFKGNYVFNSGTYPQTAETPASFTIALDGGGGFNTVYYGRAPMAGNNIVNGASNNSLVGQYLYWEVPTVPLNLSVSGHPDPGTVNIQWNAPSDSGSVALNGYRVEWAGTTSGYTDRTPGENVTTISGLTPGGVYQFRVYAKNPVTDATGVYSVPTAYSAAFVLGTVPGAPQSPAITALVGAARVSWLAPTVDGGMPVTGYTVDISTSAVFAAYTRATVGPTVRTKTFAGLTPGVTYYARVYATNGIGTGASSGSVSTAITTRTVLDAVQGASLVLADGTTVELRSDGADTPVIKLVYVPFGAANAAVDIATIPTGITSGQLYAPGGPRNLALAATPAGDIVVIGADGAVPATLRALRYGRTSGTTWAAATTLSQSLGGTEPIVGVAAHYAPGSGSSPTESMLVLTRRAGSITAGSLAYATIDIAALAAGSGALLLASGTDPAFLSTPPSADTPDTGPVDIAPLVSGGTRLAVLGNGWAVVDVTNGVVTSVAKAAASTVTPGPWARVVGVNATTFVLLTVSGGALSWAFYSATGSLLGSGTYAGANALGGAFTAQWDAIYDRVAQAVVAYYLADDSSRKLESIDISPTTYVATAAAVLTAALGAGSTTNSGLKVQHGPVDERRVIVGSANLNGATKSLATYYDLSGNIAPSAPTTADIVGFDATAAQAFGWTFGDSNPADTQTAYELVVERVSDGVAIVSTGKVVSTAQTRTVAAATLTNGVNYRWRVRTYDALDTLGTWSPYDTFATAATGTLTITAPAADNPAGLDVSAIPLTWTYVQANGYVQTQRRVRVIRVSDSSVLHDSTMQATAVQTYNAPVPSDVPVRIELSIVTNAPGTPTIGPVNRLLTTSYGSPMVPSVTLVTGEDYITVVILNPAPSGSRPATTHNIIERRDAGSSGDFVPVASVDPNVTWSDHGVASSKSYDYRVRAVSA